MANTSISDFPHPSLTVDILIFSIKNQSLQILLIKRGGEPFKNKWAIPGGFVHIDESVDDAAKRELSEETGLANVYLEQLYTFGELKRDPRAHVVSVAYFALIPSTDIPLNPDTDAADAAWYPVDSLPELAFDHAQIIQKGLNRIRTKIGYSNIAYALLPDKFKLTELQKVYEAILNQPLDKRNFRKRIFSLDLLEPLGEKVTTGAHRPAQLYRFKEKKVIFFN